jgi:hypothetical protein
MDHQLLCNALLRGRSPLLPSLACRLQFAVAFFADHMAKSCQEIRRNDLADSTVQLNMFVMVHVFRNSLLVFFSRLGSGLWCTNSARSDLMPKMQVGNFAMEQPEVR